MRKYRIGVVLQGVGAINRGTERFLLELREQLKDRYDITIFCRQKVGSYCKRIWVIRRDNKLTNFIYRIPIIRKLLNILCLDPLSIEWLTANVSSFINLYRGRFDLIISLTEVWGAISCRILRVLKKVPFVVIQKCQYSRWEVFSAAQRPNIYVALTPSVERKIKHRVKEVKTICIPQAVDIEKFSPDSIADCHFRLKRPIILSVGALEPIKRMDLVIKAVSRLKQGSLLLVGDGELRNELEKLGKCLLGEDGRFLIRNASFSDMPMYYSLCDVFTLASSSEGFGNVYLEAMACNKPIVTMRDESREEVIREAGILCDCTNIEEYTEALYKALHTDFGDIPRRQAEEFSWEKIAKKYDEIFQRIIIENKTYV